MSTFADVAAQYDAFPYPKPSLIAQQLPSGFGRGALNFLTRRRADSWLAPTMRIWIAGCGTQQAAMWALSHPEADIVATDISHGVLSIARSLAEQLGVDNVRFEQQNIADATHSESFDLVVSTGVIHHMPDPTIGAASIRRALKPDGAALIMVYNAMHRATLQPFRQAHRLLCRPGDGDDARYRLAADLLDTMLDSPRCNPLARTALESLRGLRESDRAFVADALMHPLEHSYDVEGLYTLLEAGGLRLTSWRDPAVWDVDHYVSDKALLERANALPERDRWRIVHAVAGRASPLLELIAERDDCSDRAPYSLEEVERMRVVRDHGVQGYAVAGGRIAQTGFVPPYEIVDDGITGRAGVAYGPGRAFKLPPEAGEVIEAFAKPRAIGEVLHALAPRFGKQALLELIGHLLPCDLGLLAPTELPR